MNSALLKLLFLAVPAMATSAQATAIKSVKMVAVGYGHACALLSTNQLKCWGDNSDGQLGLGDTLNRGESVDQMGDALPAVDLGTDVAVIQIGLGSAHSCVLFQDGKVKCWGDNSAGQLGLGNTRHPGILAGDMGVNLPYLDLGEGRTAAAIAVGSFFTCAILDTGALKCWGENNCGQLGLSSNTDVLGRSADTIGDYIRPINLGTGRRALSISAGGCHACAVLDDETVKCWGSNDAGELGTGDGIYHGLIRNSMGDRLPAIALGRSRVAKAVVAGNGHSCALLSDGAVKCWGWNYKGTLGLGDDMDRGIKPESMGDALPAVDLGTSDQPTILTPGSHHHCALFSAGRVKCWGSNDVGELGIDSLANRGGLPEEMGQGLPYLDFFGFGVKTIAANDRQTCAILTNGGLKCWGLNIYGQLGFGDVSNRGGQMGDMKALPFVRLWD